ncbi:hypothetical protein F4808DRAFT_462435 [Astrocystis sublimbata]|nr:hypothetical protein F4808DRAFT_462435 [Astrocystis sublimbata]
MSTVGVSINDKDIYVGIWTNWSHGRVLGSTLTVTDRNGALLVAFLALYVSFAGTMFWRLACFAFHYKLSSAEEQDGVYHQRQVILRNSTTGLQGSEQLARMLWAWRKGARRLWGRIASMLAVALASFLLFAVAGIFSSQVTTAPGDQVLLAGTNCGIPDYRQNPDANGISTILSPYLTEKIVASQEYATRCYNNITSSTKCDDFVKERLAVKVISNASCPFDATICKEHDTSLLLDTGYLDSINDLGINTPPENQFLLRRTAYCAPIKTEGYAVYDNVTEPARPVMKYLYGKLVGYPPGYGNYSFTQPVAPFVAHNRTYGHLQEDYSLGTLQAYGNTEEELYFSEFQPIRELVRPNAEVVLFFLSANNIIYSGKVDDPWFSAHSPAGLYSPSVEKGDANEFYHADEPATVLACSNQEQFCRPQPGGQPICEPLNSGFDHGDSVRSLWPDDPRMQRYMNWLYASYALNLADIRTIVRQIGIASLTARFGLQSSVQSPLPNNQWQTEVQNWFYASLATIQRLYVDVAAGPIDARIDPWLARPDSTDEKFLCHSQKIRKAGQYTSFSVLGTVIILAVGGLIIVLQLVIEPLTNWIQRHNTKTHYTQLEWVTNNTMQLQRLAHEELGFGNWSKATDFVPITEYGEKLGVLDIRDPSHPILTKTRSGTPTITEVPRADPPASEDLGSEGSIEEQNSETHDPLIERRSLISTDGSSIAVDRDDSASSEARVDLQEHPGLANQTVSEDQETTIAHG